MKDMKILFVLLLIFSIDFGNQVQLLEAKQCFYVIPGYCNTWKNFVCVLTCKGVCKSFSAHGECRDDRGCHCRCC
ncbi:hypothetical protein MtrunA17_Chr1g0151931 [Medicago truncatula]|uniref:Knottin, scorpion toxin n=1 Tax=Medicago truncatula TaxID=3880 RepID=A0A396JFZ9_MEDTR|nr:hypothetical protein MtrunA17_Chr1g0151931 [Medicago truncatula]